MSFKRKIIKVITICILVVAISAVSISVYASTYSISIPHMGSYSYVVNRGIARGIFSAGQTNISAMDDEHKYVYKEAYYQAYGYNSAIGYYGYANSYRQAKGTSNSVKTTMYPYSTNIHRAIQRVVLHSTSISTSSKIIDDSYIVSLIEP